MYDPTGVVWNAHMGFGASVLLKAFGPHSFRDGCPLSIYRQIRLFEISRSALFTQPTLLSQASWFLHDEAYLTRDRGLLEIVFDLFLQCSMLSQRFVGYHFRERNRLLIPFLVSIRSNTYADSLDSEPTTVFELVREGKALRSRLVVFSSFFCENTQALDISMAWIYYYAVSIYLSGIFDYTLCGTCDSTGISLTDNELTIHVEGILRWSEESLRHNQVSHVFLLIPLRIAGNRCSNSKQCQGVLKRLEILQGQFAVAAAFRTELLQLWSSRSLYA